MAVEDLTGGQARDRVEHEAALRRLVEEPSMTADPITAGWDAPVRAGIKSRLMDLRKREFAELLVKSAWGEEEEVGQKGRRNQQGGTAP